MRQKKKIPTLGPNVQDGKSSHADHGYALSYTFSFYLILYEVLYNTNECTQQGNRMKTLTCDQIQ